MALSAAERASVRYYLGWPSRFYQTDSALEQAMAAVDNDPDAVALVQAQLTRCADVDTKLEGADTRQKLTRAEDITFAGPVEIAMLRQQGRQAVGRLAAVLGVAVRHDIYSPSGPAGSNFMRLG
jgi:hypothetical protein